MSRLKFYILGLIAVLSVFGVQVAGILDPVTIMVKFTLLNLLPAANFLMDKSFAAFAQSFDLQGFALFLLICLSALFISRLWCRALCPLGGIYSLVARFSFLRRIVKNCASCGICKSNCCMGAIKEDFDYVKGECILCMRCVYDYPECETSFTLPSLKKSPGNN